MVGARMPQLAEGPVRVSSSRTELETVARDGIEPSTRGFHATGQQAKVNNTSPAHIAISIVSLTGCPPPDRAPNVHARQDCGNGEH